MNNGKYKNHTKSRLGILCGVACIVILVSTLWPFHPFPSNHVEWIPEANGIQLGIPGVVLSRKPLNAATGASKQPCSLELLVRPVDTFFVYAIMGFYESRSARQLLVRQWTDGLLVRHQIPTSGGRVETPKFEVLHAFSRGKLRLVTITSSPSGTIVYLDGVRAKTFPDFVVSLEELSGEIVLGTSAVDYDPWPGEIRGLAIYSKELTSAEAFHHYQSWIEGEKTGPPDLNGAIARYAFTERAGRVIHSAVSGGADLEIPKRFVIPHKVLLQYPWKEYEPNWNYVNDLLRNISGFIPLGIVLCAYLSLTQYYRNLVLFATLLGGTLSFVIEVLQAYIPQRSSGMTDIVTNTLGALLGALLWKSRVVNAILARRGFR